MLTPDEQSEILIRLDERVHSIYKNQQELKEAMHSPEGFTRCQLHNLEMDTIKDDMKEINGSLKWQKRTILGSIIAATLGVLAKIGFDVF